MESVGKETEGCAEGSVGDGCNADARTRDQEDEDMSKYTPTPKVTRPRCPIDTRKLYWDGKEGKWWCYSCNEFFSREEAEMNI